MSWLRTAVNKAVEVGNGNNISRTFKNYADSVVQQAGHAVSEGAKLLQDRIGVRTFKSVKQTIQNLEETAVSSRGHERTIQLTKWLIVLKEIDRLYGVPLEEKQATLEQLLASDGPKKQALILYHDSDIGGTPLNFRDVFLQSQALEGLTLSMILEGPNDEEITLLLEMFGLCLTGGKEVHNAIISSIQDLATAFSCYGDEVLVKREELLQFAQTAITGLKINAEMLRIDAEAAGLRKKLDAISIPEASHEGKDKTSQDTPLAIETLKAALAKIRACSRLEELLLKKKQMGNGDSPEIHAQKVDKLKVLLESLANSAAKAEKRISENRLQKEEALKVRVVKANEADEKEKELASEIAQLENERDELEAKLKQVYISLAAVQARLRDAREERDHFGEANNQIIAHLKTKDEELSKSVKACKAEAEVLRTWINFLEDTWVLQCSYAETKEKQAINELEKHEEYYLNEAIILLSTYKRELGPSISRIDKYVGNLKNLSSGSETASNANQGDAQVLNPRKILEEEYLDYEAKIVTTFSVVDNMKEQFYAHENKIERDDARIKELFEDVEKLRKEFESIERPTLQIEIPSSKPSSTAPLKTAVSSPQTQSSTSSPKSDTLSKENLQEPPGRPPVPEEIQESDLGKPLIPKEIQESELGKPPVTGEIQDSELGVHSEATTMGAETAEQLFNAEEDLAKLESEFGKVGKEYSGGEIDNWEFDELEKELRSDDSTKTN